MAKVSCSSHSITDSNHQHFVFRKINKSEKLSKPKLLFPPTDAPVCISSSVTIVGASIDESVAIACRISADPPKVSFEWTFSNSGERYEVPSGHYTTIQNFNTETDHIYLDADESGTNGNGTLILSCSLSPSHSFFFFTHL